MLRRLLRHSRGVQFRRLNTDLRDFGSLERLPGFADTISKKALYTLIINYPRMYCAPSLAPVVGESTASVRHALGDLDDNGFVETIPIPEHLQISSDTHYFRFRRGAYEKAIDYLHERFSDA